jgi:hypothetical protein
MSKTTSVHACHCERSAAPLKKGSLRDNLTLPFCCKIVLLQLNNLILAQGAAQFEGPGIVTWIVSRGNRRRIYRQFPFFK